MKRRLLLSAMTLLPLAGPVLAQESDDQVAFFRAAQMDNDRTVREVLARGLNPNVHEPERGETGLIVAMRYDANKVLNELLKHPRVNLEESSTNDTTALMMAAFKQNKAAVNALIAKGAQVNRKGWTPLHFAATAGDVEIMAILLEHYAYIDSPSPTGFTPLMLAAREGKEEAVQLLLREGADASIKDSAFKIDAAEFARRADKPWIAKAIESHQAATAAMSGK
ncbi:ankyrin repeat domain-containing protein [Pseudoduganella ginsengisoli]|uniref:Ankyrin repeat domain-containing protein n=1 Tax=Pseudoduganella ginsengisoli TaxID=1462440 RepID=A0A6L6Q608_9BURK|nr:ankyrin repeat domain-containing protein [Pseudoduganella ginsengisoli]MTW04899.1 ankyrin repeat domain-containing protein [Pseudoduganella ginsengisoli]